MNQLQKLLDIKNKLRNDDIIRSVSNNQEQILKWISILYLDGNIFEYDPTYSKGNFYKNLLKPSFKSDILYQSKDLDFIADSTNLPIKSNSINSISFDPPFVMGSGPSLESSSNKNSNIISRRFGTFKNEVVLWKFYYLSLVELYRILKEGGVLCFKCQDCVVSAKQCLSHITIINYAYRLGLYPKDLFILVSDSRVLNVEAGAQQHARKYHSYFLIFIKEKCKVKYF